MGATTYNGVEAYSYQDVLTTDNGSGWDVISYVSCDYQGDEGMFLLGWNGASNEVTELLGFPITNSYIIDAVLSPPRRYLSPEYAVGFEGSWNYSYTLNMTVDFQGSPTPVTQPATGTYSDAGFEDIELFDGQTVTAYRLVNQFEIVDSFGTATPGYIEQYWVKGLGMVREIYVNPTSSATVLSKELSSYSGLSVIE